MRPSPWNDLFLFLTKPEWTTFVFWPLLLASGLIAIRVWRGNPGQRTARHLAIYALRVLVGGMWWQQTLWKIPPNFDGLVFWMKQMAEHSAIVWQGDLVGALVVPNIWFFGPLVYLTEAVIGISLMLGLFSRGGALLGLAMAVNLWLGLYSAPNEWPWTYGYLIVIQAFFAIDPPGRVLGADALLTGRRR
jgi:uncharacterized membrane protein YphA (DoxX/SURF4 family)